MKFKYILLFSFFLLMANTAYVQGLCENFGQNGIAAADFSHDTYFRASALQADGKIILVGHYNDEEAGADMLVFRIWPDGSLDESFGDRGHVTIAVNSDFNDAYSVVITSDGTIIVGGGGIVQGGVLAALHSSGDRVNNFGNSGKLFLGGTGPVWDLVADGDTVYAIHGAGSGFQLTAVMSDGQFHTGFGNNGSQLILSSTGNVFPFRPMHLKQLNDGKLLVAVTAEADVNPGVLDDLLLYRILADGTTDTGWGTNGQILEPESEGYHCADMLIDDSGKIITGGYTTDPDPTLTTVISHRFLSNGNADGSFNNIGSSIHSTGIELKDLALASDGTLYFTGRQTLNGQVSFCLAAYKADGTNDTDFGTVDWLIPDDDVVEGEMNSLIQYPDGSFLAAGAVSLSDNSTRGIATRLNSMGAAQLDWGTTGYLWGHTVEVSHAYVVKEDADASLLAAGIFRLEGFSGSDAAPAIARFHPDGSLDMDFGFRGKVYQDVSEYPTFFHSLEILSDGKVLAAGKFGISRGWTLARLHPDGRNDSTFGINGWLQYRLGCSSCSSFGEAMALDNNGNILLAGYAGFQNGTSREDPVVARLLPNGDPDPTFGTSGFVHLDMVTLDHGFLAVASLPDNSILAAGFQDSLSGNGAYLLCKFTPGGALDSSFATNGVFTWSQGVANSEFHEIRTLPNGKILLTGTYQDNNNSSNDKRAVIIQLMSDGTFDSTFGGNGIAAVSYPNSRSHKVAGLMIDSQNNLLLTGRMTVQGARTFVAKFTDDGQPDMSFGDQGVYFQLEPNVFLGGPPIMLEDTRFIAPGETLYVSEFAVVCMDLNPGSTSIGEMNLPNSLLTVFPNPASTRIHFRLPEQRGKAEVYLIDINGRIWMQQHMDLDVSNEFSLGEAPAGLYIVIVETKHQRYSSRLIKTP